MSLRLRFAALVLISPLVAALSVQAQEPEPERVRIHGSNVLGERLVPALVSAWLQEAGYTDAKQRSAGKGLEFHARRDAEAILVEIESRGTTSGFSDLIAGEAEIGMAARAPTAKELDDAWLIGKLQSPDLEFVVAIDGLEMLVHPSNKVKALSREQLRDIFSGRIRDWSELGGKPGAIRLHGRPVGSGPYESMVQLVMKGAVPSAPVQVHQASAALITAVASDPQALAYGRWLASAPGTVSLAVSDGGRSVHPSRVNGLAEDYPLTRRLNLHGSQSMSALGRSFALFTLSAKGQDVVRREGFAALTPSGEPAIPDVSVPDEYSQMLAGAQRLGVNLRFGHEYTLLDSRGVQDLHRIVEFMAQPENKGRQLMLMAFANPFAGEPSRALFQSHDRVDFVAGLLAESGVNVSRRRGFGGAAPLAQGKDDFARFRNERVELWIR